MLRKLENYPSDRALTDLLARLIVVFGVALIAGGFYSVIAYASASTQVAQTSSAAKSVVSILDWIPGIPFYVCDLADFSAATIGLVSWILGIGLLLVGLGLWGRRRLARLAALAIFGAAAFFQFVQFLLLGFLGSPISIVELCADGVIVYSLLSRFDSTDQTCHEGRRLWPKWTSRN
jgi:hypothetical protein